MGTNPIWQDAADAPRTVWASTTAEWWEVFDSEMLPGGQLRIQTVLDKQEVQLALQSFHCILCEWHHWCMVFATQHCTGEQAPDGESKPWV